LDIPIEVSRLMTAQGRQELKTQFVKPRATGEFAMRKTSWVTLALLLLLLVGFSCSSHAKELTLNNVPVQVYFSPQGGCTDAIVAELNKAKKEVLVQAYSFTSQPIAKAMVEAHKRGVRTEVILDKSQRGEKYSAADFTAHMGVPTYIDSAHAIAHNKIMVIDQETVITGSFNFTRAAEERNAENVLIIRSKELAKEYLDNWEKHKAHSEKYEGR
jgi:phosphatidylserine/phosphatidylglycerophosphate/cardiolipin synthase-like enzyme